MGRAITERTDTPSQERMVNFFTRGRSLNMHQNVAIPGDIWNKVRAEGALFPMHHVQETPVMNGKRTTLKHLRCVKVALLEQRPILKSYNACCRAGALRCLRMSCSPWAMCPVLPMGPDSKVDTV